MLICLMIASILLPVVRFENWEVRSVSDTRLSSSRRWPDVVGLPTMPKSRWSRPVQWIFECKGIDLYYDALRCASLFYCANLEKESNNRAFCDRGKWPTSEEKNESTSKYKLHAMFVYFAKTYAKDMHVIASLLAVGRWIHQWWRDWWDV